jgi:hypothetical protein
MHPLCFGELLFVREIILRMDESLWNFKIEKSKEGRVGGGGKAGM